MAKLKIKCDHKTPFGAKILLDGQELKSITKLDFNMDVEGVNRATIEFLVDKVEIDSEVEAKFTFKKGISKEI